MLNRGELKDWFHSSEIWIVVTVARLALYLFTVYKITTDERSFLDRDLLTSANFIAGTLLMFCGGLIMTGTLALLPTMPRNLKARTDCLHHGLPSQRRIARRGDRLHGSVRTTSYPSNSVARARETAQR